MKVVYADVLVIINFSMDLCALYLTALLCRIKLSIPRAAAAAAVGGLYSLCDFLVNWPIPFIEIAVNIIFAFIMCVIAFKANRWKILVYTALFYFICFAIGGAVTGIYSLANSSWSIMRQAGYIYSDISLLEVIGVTCAALIITKAGTLFTRSRRKKKYIDVKISVLGKQCSATALVDSGCIVKEPISNKDVIFMSEKIFRQLFSEEHNTDDIEYFSLKGIKICFIPIKTVAGNGGVIAIRPDLLLCNNVNMDAYVAFTDFDARGFSGFEAIVPDTFI